jgi:hypothetical protein
MQASLLGNTVQLHDRNCSGGRVITERMLLPSPATLLGSPNDQFDPQIAGDESGWSAGVARLLPCSDKRFLETECFILCCRA